MKLKLLFVPLAILLIAYWIIWRVIPVYNGPDGVSVKMQALEEINAKKADMEKRVANAAKLANDLNYNIDQQTVIRQYLPEKRKEEEIISSLSAIASSKSIGITNIDVKENSTAPAHKATAIDSETGAAAASNENLLQKINVEIKTVGNYAGLREFVVALTKLKRFNEIESLDLNPAPDNAEIFTASISISFNYLNKITSITNVDEKIFASDSFDMRIMDDIKNTTNLDISAINIGQSGRINPFAL